DATVTGVQTCALPICPQYALPRNHTRPIGNALTSVQAEPNEEFIGFSKIGAPGHDDWNRGGRFGDADRLAPHEAACTCELPAVRSEERRVGKGWSRMA